jgi:hypothetical protein
MGKITNEQLEALGQSWTVAKKEVHSESLGGEPTSPGNEDQMHIWRDFEQDSIDRLIKGLQKGDLSDCKPVVEPELQSPLKTNPASSLNVSPLRPEKYGRFGTHLNAAQSPLPLSPAPAKNEIHSPNSYLELDPESKKKFIECLIALHLFKKTVTDFVADKDKNYSIDAPENLPVLEMLIQTIRKAKDAFIEIGPSLGKNDKNKDARMYLYCIARKYFDTAEKIPSIPLGTAMEKIAKELEKMKEKPEKKIFEGLAAQVDKNQSQKYFTIAYKIGKKEASSFASALRSDEIMKVEHPEGFQGVGVINKEEITAFGKNKKSEPVKNSYDFVNKQYDGSTPLQDKNAALKKKILALSSEQAQSFTAEDIRFLNIETVQSFDDYLGAIKNNPVYGKISLLHELIKNRREVLESANKKLKALVDDPLKEHLLFKNKTQKLEDLVNADFFDSTQKISNISKEFKSAYDACNPKDKSQVMNLADKKEKLKDVEDKTLALFKAAEGKTDTLIPIMNELLTQCATYQGRLKKSDEENANKFFQPYHTAVSQLTVALEALVWETKKLKKDADGNEVVEYIPDGIFADPKNNTMVINYLKLLNKEKALNEKYQEGDNEKLTEDLLGNTEGAEILFREYELLINQANKLSRDLSVIKDGLKKHIENAENAVAVDYKELDNKFKTLEDSYHKLSVVPGMNDTRKKAKDAIDALKTSLETALAKFYQIDMENEANAIKAAINQQMGRLAPFAGFINSDGIYQNDAQQIISKKDDRDVINARAIIEGGQNADLDKEMSLNEFMSSQAEKANDLFSKYRTKEFDGISKIESELKSYLDENNENMNASLEYAVSTIEDRIETAKKLNDKKSKIEEQLRGNEAIDLSSKIKNNESNYQDLYSEADIQQAIDSLVKMQKELEADSALVEETRELYPFSKTVVLSSCDELDKEINSAARIISAELKNLKIALRNYANKNLDQPFSMFEASAEQWHQENEELKIKRRDKLIAELETIKAESDKSMSEVNDPVDKVSLDKASETQLNEIKKTCQSVLNLHTPGQNESYDDAISVAISMSEDPDAVDLAQPYQNDIDKKYTKLKERLKEIVDYASERSQLIDRISRVTDDANNLKPTDSDLGDKILADLKSQLDGLCPSKPVQTLQPTLFNSYSRAVRAIANAEIRIAMKIAALADKNQKMKEHEEQEKRKANVMLIEDSISALTQDLVANYDQLKASDALANPKLTAADLMRDSHEQSAKTVDMLRNSSLDDDELDNIKRFAGTLKSDTKKNNDELSRINHIINDTFGDNEVDAKIYKMSMSSLGKFNSKIDQLGEDAGKNAESALSGRRAKKEQERQKEQEFLVLANLRKKENEERDKKLVAQIEKNLKKIQKSMDDSFTSVKATGCLDAEGKAKNIVEMEKLSDENLQATIKTAETVSATYLGIPEALTQIATQVTATQLDQPRKQALGLMINKLNSRAPSEHKVIKDASERAAFILSERKKAREEALLDLERRRQREEEENERRGKEQETRERERLKKESDDKEKATKIESIRQKDKKAYEACDDALKDSEESRMNNLTGDQLSKHITKLDQSLKILNEDKKSLAEIRVADSPMLKNTLKDAIQDNLKWSNQIKEGMSKLVKSIEARAETVPDTLNANHSSDSILKASEVEAELKKTENALNLIKLDPNHPTIFPAQNALSAIEKMGPAIKAAQKALDDEESLRIEEELLVRRRQDEIMKQKKNQEDIHEITASLKKVKELIDSTHKSVSDTARLVNGAVRTDAEMDQLDDPVISTVITVAQAAEKVYQKDIYEKLLAIRGKIILLSDESERNPLSNDSVNLLTLSRKNEEIARVTHERALGIQKKRINKKADIDSLKNGDQKAFEEVKGMVKKVSDGNELKKMSHDDLAKILTKLLVCNNVLTKNKTTLLSISPGNSTEIEDAKKKVNGANSSFSDQVNNASTPMIKYEDAQAIALLDKLNNPTDQVVHDAEVLQKQLKPVLIALKTIAPDADNPNHDLAAKAASSIDKIGPAIAIAKKQLLAMKLQRQSDEDLEKENEARREQARKKLLEEQMRNKEKAQELENRQKAFLVSLNNIIENTVSAIKPLTDPRYIEKDLKAQTKNEGDSYNINIDNVKINDLEKVDLLCETAVEKIEELRKQITQLRTKHANDPEKSQLILNVIDDISKKVAAVTGLQAGIDAKRKNYIQLATTTSKKANNLFRDRAKQASDRSDLEKLILDFAKNFSTPFPATNGRDKPLYNAYLLASQAIKDAQNRDQSPETIDNYIFGGMPYARPPTSSHNKAPTADQNIINLKQIYVDTMKAHQSLANEGGVQNRGKRANNAKIPELNYSVEFAITDMQLEKLSDKELGNESGYGKGLYPVAKNLTDGFDSSYKVLERKRESIPRNQNLQVTIDGVAVTPDSLQTLISKCCGIATDVASLALAEIKKRKDLTAAVKKIIDGRDQFASDNNSDSEDLKLKELEIGRILNAYQEAGKALSLLAKEATSRPGGTEARDNFDHAVIENNKYIDQLKELLNKIQAENSARLEEERHRLELEEKMKREKEREEQEMENKGKKQLEDELEKKRLDDSAKKLKEQKDEEGEVAENPLFGKRLSNQSLILPQVPNENPRYELMSWDQLMEYCSNYLKYVNELRPIASANAHDVLLHDFTNEKAAKLQKIADHARLRCIDFYKLPVEGMTNVHEFIRNSFAHLNLPDVIDKGRFGSSVVPPFGRSFDPYIHSVSAKINAILAGDIIALQKHIPVMLAGFVINNEDDYKIVHSSLETLKAAIEEKSNFLLGTLSRDRSVDKLDQSGQLIETILVKDFSPPPFGTDLDPVYFINHKTEIEARADELRSCVPFIDMILDKIQRDKAMLDTKKADEVQRIKRMLDTDKGIKEIARHNIDALNYIYTDSLTAAQRKQAIQSIIDQGPGIVVIEVPKNGAKFSMLLEGKLDFGLDPADDDNVVKAKIEDQILRYGHAYLSKKVQEGKLNQSDIEETDSWLINHPDPRTDKTSADRYMRLCATIIAKKQSNQVAAQEQSFINLVHGMFKRTTDVKETYLIAKVAPGGWKSDSMPEHLKKGVNTAYDIFTQSIDKKTFTERLKAKSGLKEQPFHIVEKINDPAKKVNETKIYLPNDNDTELEDEDSLVVLWNKSSPLIIKISDSQWVLITAKTKDLKNKEKEVGFYQRSFDSENAATNGALANRAYSSKDKGISTDLVSSFDHQNSLGIGSTTGHLISTLVTDHIETEIINNKLNRVTTRERTNLSPNMGPKNR